MLFYEIWHITHTAITWWCLDWKFHGDGDGLGNVFLLNLKRFCQYMF